MTTTGTAPTATAAHPFDNDERPHGALARKHAFNCHEVYDRVYAETLRSGTATHRDAADKATPAHDEYVTWIHENVGLD